MRLYIAISSAIAAVILIVVILTKGPDGPPSAIQTATWPSTITGQLVTAYGGSNLKSLPAGTVLSPQTIAKSEAGNTWVTSFYGRTGYALASINGYQYPLISRNGGRTWSTSAPYWSRPAGNAGVGAKLISTFSTTTVSAYGNQWIYSTSDGGRQWYLSSPFNVESVEPSRVEWWVPHMPTNGIIANVSQNGSHKDFNKVIGRAQYLTTNGGKTWRLLPAPA